MKKVDSSYFMTLGIIMILIGCGMHNQSPRTASASVGEGLYNQPAVIHKVVHQDTPKTTRLNRQEAIFRQDIRELIRNTNTAFKDIRDIKGRTMAYDTLIPRILAQQVLLFDRARQVRLDKDSVQDVNKALNRKLIADSLGREQLRRDFEKFAKEASQYSTAQNKVDTDNSWYKWLMMFFVGSTFIFTFVTYFRSPKSQL